MTSQRRGPWEGLRVVDLSTGIAGAYASRVFAGLGADVVKIEQIGAPDPLRSLGTDLGPATTGFTAYNVDKRSVRLRLEEAGDREKLSRLLSAADVLIDTERAERRQELGLSGSQISDQYPHLVHATITPFGDVGPYATWGADDLVLSALSGWMSVQGHSDREPLSTGTDLLSLLIGNAAVVAISAALTGRDRDGYGQHIDVRGLEVAVATQIFDTVAHSYTGRERRRQANAIEEPWAVLSTRDGYAALARSAMSAWEELWLPIFGDEVPEWVLDPNVQASGDEIRAALEALIQTRSTREFVALCQLLGHIVGEVLSIEEVLDSPQHEARSYFDDIKIGTTQLKYPGPPVRFQETPWFGSREGARSVPALGEHTDEVLDDWGSPRPRPRGASDARAVLEGIRVIDFTMGWAGPYATQLLADLGAEVIKVESIGRTDWWRTARRMFTAGEEDPDWLWEASPLWNSVNESKRGITLDLTDDRCRTIARRLVETADLVVENFTPRVMASFGLSYEEVARLRPEAVMVSMPGFGADGPWGSYRSTALVTEAMAGLTGRVGYADGPPQVIQMSPADPNAGMVAAWAAIAALRVARQTGRGQHVEVSQVEAMTHHLTWEILECQASGVTPPRRENSVPGALLSGCWPAADPDGWVVVSLRNAKDSDALRGVVGRADEEVLAQFIRERDARSAAETLQAAGVPAADVRSAAEVRRDPHLAETAFFHATDRPFVGVHCYPSTPFRASRMPLAPRRPAPTLGEHTRQVLSEWIGTPDTEIDEYITLGLIGTEPRGTRDGKVVSE